MAKPCDTARTKWKLTAGTPTRFLERKHAVEWAQTTKLPYTIEKGMGGKKRGHVSPMWGKPYWELRVYQPTMWQGKEARGSSNYNIPFPTKKQAENSYMANLDKYKLVRLPTGAYIYVASAAQTRRFGGKTFNWFGTERSYHKATLLARKLRRRGWRVRVVKSRVKGKGTRYLLYRGQSR